MKNKLSLFVAAVALLAVPAAVEAHPPGFYANGYAASAYAGWPAARSYNFYASPYGYRAFTTSGYVATPWGVNAYNYGGAYVAPYGVNAYYGVPSGYGYAVGPYYSSAYRYGWGR